MTKLSEEFDLDRGEVEAFLGEWGAATTAPKGIIVLTKIPTTLMGSSRGWTSAVVGNTFPHISIFRELKSQGRAEFRKNILGAHGPGWLVTDDGLEDLPEAETIKYSKWCEREGFSVEPETKPTPAPIPKLIKNDWGNKEEPDTRYVFHPIERDGLSRLVVIGKQSYSSEESGLKSIKVLSSSDLKVLAKKGWPVITDDDQVPHKLRKFLK